MQAPEVLNKVVTQLVVHCTVPDSLSGFDIMQDAFISISMHSSWFPHVVEHLLCGSASTLVLNYHVVHNDTCGHYIM